MDLISKAMGYENFKRKKFENILQDVRNESSEELEMLTGEPEWFQAAVNSFLVLSGIVLIIYLFYIFLLFFIRNGKKELFSSRTGGGFIRE